MNICVIGAGAALGKELINHYTRKSYHVTAYGRSAIVLPHNELLTLIPGVDFATIDHSPFSIENSFDVLVTGMGSVSNGLLKTMNLSQWNEVLSNCLTSTFNSLRFGLPRVKEAGNVVVVGSIVGSNGSVGCSNYAAAKAGLVGLVRAAANEFPRLHVNLLELGYTDVGMGARLPEKVKERVLRTIPLGRFGTAEDFVHAVEFLSTTKYATGTVLNLAGGLR